MAELTEGQIELGGVLLVEPFLIQRVEGLARRPEIRRAEMTRTNTDGLVAGQRLLGGRTILIEMGVVGWDRDDINDALMALANLGVDEIPLRCRLAGVAGGNTVKAMVTVRNDDIPLGELYLSHALDAALELRALDPRLYSDTLTTVTLLSTTVTGGKSFPWTFPFTFGGSGNAGNANLVNLGNYNAPLTVEIHGPISQPRLRNETTGKEIFYNDTLAAGEWLEIDTKAHTVLLNGVANRYYRLGATQWWDLAPGINQVRFFGATSTGALAHLTFGSAWI
jgi:hypothetical protein